MERSTLDNLCNALKWEYRTRTDLHRAEKRLTLQVRALTRRAAHRSDCEGCGFAPCSKHMKEATALYKALESGEAAEQHPLYGPTMLAAFPLLEARKTIRQHRKQSEKALEKLAKQLPVFTWVEQVRGVSALSLAAIVGACGSLSNYPNPAKLWKRLGLAVMDGCRQGYGPDGKAVRGATAVQHGYSRERRSLMFVVGDSILKAQGPESGGELRAVYTERKVHELAKAAAEGLDVKPSAKIRTADREQCRSEGQVHRRAQRYMEKRFLLLLWKAWRETLGEAC